MTVQSLKTIGQSNLDLERTLPLKMAGGHLGNNTAHTKIFFQKLSLLTPNEHRKSEYDILNHFAVIRKST